ncbi:MAG: M23 family metallopeptidase [Deltaproteobacteria bacterium]|nr:M23 family metallopeptidase [Deltaproteobacteria bacterium]
MFSSREPWNWDRLLGLLKQSKNLFTTQFWKKVTSKPEAELTLVLLSKGHREVQKLHLSPTHQWFIKVASVAGVVLFVFSGIFLIDFLIHLPERSILKTENSSLKKELNKLQYHMDALQTSLDRVSRFDQKLRALTEVDKEFAKMKGPIGQGGGVVEDPANQKFDFGDFQVDSSQLDMDEDSTKYLDRREVFLFQKLYSWMRRLYKDSELSEQSVEELFEVLKGREIQIAATPSIIPVQGWITSHFGYRMDPFTGRRAMHRGLDVAAKEGTPVLAPADGIVTFSGANGGFGNTVMVFHGYGISTLYAHAENVNVRQGQKVKRGDVIAFVGNSGRSTAAHLHYEVIVHGVPVDPRKYVLDRML